MHRGGRHGRQGVSVRAIDLDRSGVGFAQAEAHALELDFDRIAQGRDLHHLHKGAGEQTHGQQTLEGRVIGGTGTDPPAFAGPQRRQRTG
jgi:hypothetical protein